MRTTSATIALFAISIALAPAAFAAPSVAENFETCRAEAEIAYGNGNEAARVRLDDVRKSGRQLLMRVVTPAGESFNAVCEVNRKSGELIALDPQPAASNTMRVSVLTAN